MIDNKSLKRRLGRNSLQIIILLSILIVIIIIAGIIKPGFLTVRHLLAIAHDSSVLGIVAIGQTMVILTGGIDISVGSNMLLIDVVGARLLNGENRLLPILICLGLGILIGAVNGVGIAYLRVPPFIMTLVMMIIISGSVFIYTKSPSGWAAPILRFLSVEKVGKIPILIFIWLFLSALMAVILKFSVFGRKVYAIGSNPLASLHSGTRNKIIILFVYIICSVFATIAGLILLGYTGTPYLSYKGGLGMDFTLLSIAGVLVGGTVFVGARGGIERTVVGVLILKILFSILAMLGLGEPGKLIIQGAIIIFMISVYTRLETTRY